MMMQPIHLRMARAALGWTLKDLALKAQVNLNTISRYEAGREVLSSTIRSIERVLVAEGIVFIEEGEGTELGVILVRQTDVRLGGPNASWAPQDPPLEIERKRRKTRTSKTKTK